MSKEESIIEAFKIAHRDGIAGYAIETKYGWSASDRKPIFAFGKIIECLASGRTQLA